MGDLKDTHYLDSIWFTYDTPEYLRLEQSTRTILAIQHKFSQTDTQAVRVFNLMTQVHQFEVITLGLKILLGFIGTLTLGIGGVGLMNIMLVSVSQRTREIGMQKALGARKRHILMQFLAEALTITFMGGLLGILLAYVVALSAGRLTLYSAVQKMVKPVTSAWLSLRERLSLPPSFWPQSGWSAGWYLRYEPPASTPSRPCVTSSISACVFRSRPGKSPGTRSYPNFRPSDTQTRD